MNLILAVEYFFNRSLVRVTLQFEIEDAIMAENSNQFRLVYLSPLLQFLIVEKLRISRDPPVPYNLLH